MLYVGRTINLNADEVELVNKCVGKECKNNKDFRDAISSMANKLLKGEGKQENISEKEVPKKEKHKGKFHPVKPMSIEHIPQTPPQQQEHPHKAHLENMPKGINYLHCTNCGKMENPKGLTDRYVSCPDCEANTVPKGAKVCPYCGSEHDSDEWEDEGIEIER